MPPIGSASAHPVREDLDVFDVRRAARRLAIELGFPRRAAEEIVIVVSELATNILKHGGEGSITLGSIEDPEHGPGLCVVAEDHGPAISDWERAVQDRHTPEGPVDPATTFGRKGIGSGLGAVQRLMDRLTYEATPAGNRFEAVRYARPR